MAWRIRMRSPAEVSWALDACARLNWTHVCSPRVQPEGHRVDKPRQDLHDEELFKSAVVAARLLSDAADALRDVEASLPLRVSRMTRSELQAIADRIDQVADDLARETDRPTPSPTLLKRIAWVGAGVGMLMAPILAGTAEGISGSIAEQQLEQIQQTTTSACEEVLSAASSGHVAPLGILSDSFFASVVAPSLVTIPLDSGGGFNLEVAPSGGGGLWISESPTLAYFFDLSFESTARRRLRVGSAPIELVDFGGIAGSYAIEPGTSLEAMPGDHLTIQYDEGSGPEVISVRIEAGFRSAQRP